MDPVTARYWLKRDHREEHLRWWPNAATLMAEAAEERELRGAVSRPIRLDLPEADADEIAAELECQ
jgi:hypothetical protein